GGDLALVAGHDGRLAAHVQGADQPRGVHDGDLLIVALVLGPAGDVLDAAVAVVGGEGELLLVLPGQDPVLGVDRDPGHDRVVLLAEGHAGGDPAADQLVLVGADLDALAAGVGHGAGGLE